MSDILTVVLGGVTLPDQTKLVETTSPNETDVETLNGTLYTDFMNWRRSWAISFPPLCKEDYDAIYDAYQSQYTNETYLSLVCTALGINTVVKANISDADIKFNGDRVDGFGLALKEAYAIS